MKPKYLIIIGLAILIVLLALAGLGIYEVNPSTDSATMALDSQNFGTTTP